MSDKAVKFDFRKGELLLIDKPVEWTSFDVVKKIRNMIKRRYPVKKIKVGHAGTLDPLATGLLLICTGKFTKKLAEFQHLDKEYTGTITLGATTPSYDLETPIDQRFDISGITNDMVHDAAKKLTGEIQQVPPSFSAKRINGEKAYTKARKGEPVTLKSQQIRVHEFEITDISLPHVDFRIRCSKGTYVRSLASDFGKALDNGAYLSNLCRTKIGGYLLENALMVADLEASMADNSMILD